jgi:ATP-dependent RNA helicase RhlE
MTVSFESLGLSETVLEGVRASGYKAPTEIQERTIPLALEGKDLIGLGETGSGKTAAFGLPILHRLHGEEAGLRALILVPTRELCVQVAEDLRRYGQGTGLHICTAFGGIDIGIQESAFKRGLDLLVACPGRLIDHLERRNLTLENVSTVVLDEADRMLDMGFLPQIRRIFVRCPLRRQNWLFSATMLPEVEELCGNFMPEAVRVQIGGLSQTPRTISHRFVAISNTDKERFTEELLRRQDRRVLIFVNRKSTAEKLGRMLKRIGFPADSIHGDKSAEARHAVLRAFESGRTRFLVATDVAARGIDVDDIGVVLNFDMPMAVEDYIHRIGRTGRAGASGTAITLVAPIDRRMHKSVIGHLNGESTPGTGDRPGGGPGGRGRGGRGGRPRDGGKRRKGRPGASA